MAFASVLNFTIWGVEWVSTGLLVITIESVAGICESMKRFKGIRASPY